MPIRLVINGREITHPFAKGAIVLGISLLAFCFMLILLFVILPLLGLAFALTTALLLAVLFASLLAALVSSLLLSRGQCRRKIWSDRQPHQKNRERER